MIRFSRFCVKNGSEIVQSLGPFTALVVSVITLRYWKMETMIVGHTRLLTDELARIVGTYSSAQLELPERSSSQRSHGTPNPDPRAMKRSQESSFDGPPSTTIMSRGLAAGCIAPCGFGRDRQQRRQLLCYALFDQCVQLIRLWQPNGQ